MKKHNKCYLDEKGLVRDLIGYIRGLGVKGVFGEVQTPAGRIDVLTPRLLIEAKAIQSWKAGVGQLLAYGQYHPQKRLVLFTFGRFYFFNQDSNERDYGKRSAGKKSKKRTIKDVCDAHNIIHFYYHDGCDFNDFKEHLSKSLM